MFLRWSAIVLMVVACAAPSLAVSPDDTARVLAGMPVAANSPLAKLTETADWKKHAKHFDQAFAVVETRQLSRVRNWSVTAVPAMPSNGSLLYFFSGPDFMYADAFFPRRKTYLMSGLEPVGPIPDIEAMPHKRLFGALDTLKSSLSTILNVSFFRTIDMRSQLRSSALSGTVPVLYVFMVRAGKTIHDVSLVDLTVTGDVRPHEAGTKPAQGVQIVFSTPGGERQTLYYFSGDVSNAGFRKSGLEAFARKLENPDALVKSASYLLHSTAFSDVRDLLRSQARALLQDDTGVPLAYLAKDRTLTPFGNYNGPIPMFAGRFQKDLAALFKQAKRQPLPFGVGYRWRENDSNLLLAVKP
jgi:hypothetical protein